MNIELITVGKTKSGFVNAGVEEYSKRLKRYINFSITELPDVKNGVKIGKEAQKESEGKLILAKVQPHDHLVLLDERGKQYSSEEFSKKIEDAGIKGMKCLKLVIGGPYGFSKSVYDRADELLSLSKMTFNHEMVRIFITEQIYRAMTIQRGEPYHHA